MKILVVTHNNNLSSGGANTSLLAVLDGLKDKFEFNALVNKTPGDLPVAIENLGIKTIECDYSWCCIPNNHKDIKNTIKIYLKKRKKYFLEQKTIADLLEKIRYEEYDLVYSNTSVIDVGAIIAKKLDIPHVWHIREYGEKIDCFFYFTKRSQRKEYYKQAKKIITVSDSLNHYYKKTMGLSNIETVYNGFDLDKYKYSEQKELQKPIQVLISGILTKRKGQDIAIKAINKLSKEYNIYLNIAGKGNVKEIKNFLPANTNYNNINFLGPVSNLYDFRKKMDIEVVCSTNEAFGKVTIEAMLHSLPVIGNCDSCTKELIQDGFNGLHFKRNNVNDLVRKIKKVITDENLRNTLIKNAYESSQKYAMENTVKKVSENFETKERKEYTYGVVIVNYLAYKETIKCIKSFDEFAGIKPQYVIVDNGSKNDSYNILKNEFKTRSDIKVVKLNKNIGFAKANNYGYKKLVEKVGRIPDFIIISNDDIILKEFGLGDWIKNEYQKTKFDVLGPSIYSLGKNYKQNPMRNKTKSNSDLNKIRLKIKNIVRTQNDIPYIYKDSEWYDTSCSDKTLHGSFIVFSKKYFLDYNEPFDNRTFLYGEEDILKLRCEHKNMLMYYSNKYEVNHRQAASSNMVFYNASDYKMFKRKNELKSLAIYTKVLKEYKMDED